MIGTLPDQISANKEFLTELIGNLHQSLNIASGSNLRVTLAQNDEHLDQFELKNVVATCDKEFLTRLHDALTQKADIFVEAEPGKLTDEELTWLEIKRLGRLLTHVEASFELDLHTDDPRLVVLWKVDKMDEEV